MQQMRMECDEMTAPTPEGIIMWHAAIEAAAGLFHDEQMTIWSSEIMADMALDAGVQPADYDGVVDCYRAIRETLTEIGNAIRALPPPAALSAAPEVQALVEAAVKRALEAAAASIRAEEKSSVYYQGRVQTFCYGMRDGFESSAQVAEEIAANPAEVRRIAEGGE